MEASHSVAHHDAGAHSSALAGGATASQRHAQDSTNQDGGAHEYDYSAAVVNQYSTHTPQSGVADSRSSISATRTDQDGEAQWLVTRDACMHDLTSCSSTTSAVTETTAAAAAQTTESTYLARSGPVATELARDDNEPAAPAQVPERRRSVQDLVSERMHVGSSSAVADERGSTLFEQRSSATKRHARNWSGMFHTAASLRNSSSSALPSRHSRLSSPASSYSLPSSPQPPSLFVATQLRHRSHALRRRATSLPPPIRPQPESSAQPSQLKSTKMDASSSTNSQVGDVSPTPSARANAAPYTTAWHHRQRRELRDGRICSSSTSRGITDERRRTRLLSQGDLIAHHAVRSLKKGSKVVITPTSLSPPITKSTLRELDLTEILRNPQLRHDSVFDPHLMFRPNYDGERGVRKRELASQYWTAVTREVRDRCRCTTFLDGQTLPCICSTSTSTAGKLFDRLPSRIAPLIHELRAIVLSLLPSPSSTTPVWASSPSSAAVTRDQIFETLDPAFISQQLTRGVLDVGSLAKFLGQTLKMHCAPMRDALVDEMVEACTSDDVVGGLRLCFEILELMKLDIANHQLRTLRPYLVQTALDFEQRFFNDVVLQRSSVAARTSLELTTKWLSKATAAAQLKSSASSWESAPAVVREGVLSLVFEAQPDSPLPETFQLDAYRLSAFHSDVTDLTCVYLLLSLFKELASPAKPSDTQLDDMRREIWCILASVNHNTSGEGSQASSNVVTGLAKLDTAAWRASVQDAGLQIAARAHAIKTGMSSSTPDKSTIAVVESYITTHLGAKSNLFQLLQDRLKATLSSVVAEELSNEDKRRWWLSSSDTIPVNDTQAPAVSGSRKLCATRSVALVVEPSVVAASPSRGCKRSLDGEDENVDRVSKKRKAGDAIKETAHSIGFDILLTRNGLTPLKNEVRVLGERISRVTSFHLAVYREWYAELLTNSRP
ncbi:hypothetical protein ACM66B_005432 [Microbotryomycetes sp. NB124-2]